MKAKMADELLGRLVDHMVGVEEAEADQGKKKRAAIALQLCRRISTTSLSPPGPDTLRDCPLRLVQNLMLIQRPKEAFEAERIVERLSNSSGLQHPLSLVYLLREIGEHRQLQRQCLMTSDLFGSASLPAIQRAILDKSAEHSGLSTFPQPSSSFATPSLLVPSQPSKPTPIITPSVSSSSCSSEPPKAVEERPEREMVKDCLFAMQGLDGSFIKFHPSTLWRIERSAISSTGISHTNFDVKEDAFVVESREGLRVSREQNTMIARICRLGVLFRRLRSFVDHHQQLHSPSDEYLARLLTAISSGQSNEEDQSRVSQENSDLAKWILSRSSSSSSFSSSSSAGGSQIHPSSSIQWGLTVQSFYGFVQQQLTDFYRQLSLLEAQLDHKETPEKQEITLKRLFVWAQEPLQQFEQMVTMVEKARGKFGGRLISVLEAYISSRGEPFFRDPSASPQKLLQQICQPLFQMIQSWIVDGHLLRSHSSGDLLSLDEFFIGEDRDCSSEIWSKRYFLRPSMIPSFISPSLASKIMRIGKSVLFMREHCNRVDLSSEREQLQKWIEVVCVYDAKLPQRLEEFVEKAEKIVDLKLVRHLIEAFRFMDHLSAIKKLILLQQGDFSQALMALLQEELKKPSKSLYIHDLRSSLDSAIRTSNAQFEHHKVLENFDVILEDQSDQRDGWNEFALIYHAEKPLDMIFSASSLSQYRQVFKLLWRLRRIEHQLYSSWDPKVQREMMQEHRWFIVRNEMMRFMSSLQFYASFDVIERSWSDLWEEVQTATNVDQLIEAHSSRFLSSVMSSLFLTPQTRPQLQHLFGVLDSILLFASLLGELVRTKTGQLNVVDEVVITKMTRSQQNQQEETISAINLRLGHTFRTYRQHFVNLARSLALVSSPLSQQLLDFEHFLHL